VSCSGVDVDVDDGIRRSSSCSGVDVDAGLRPGLGLGLGIVLVLAYLLSFFSLLLLGLWTGSVVCRGLICSFPPIGVHFRDLQTRPRKRARARAPKEGVLT
jgi:hypothetical protein